MQLPPRLTLPRLLFGLSALLSSGCMNYGMPYGGYPGYGQPMYAPPQMLNQQAPGTLIIPESGGPAYDPANPSRTYETDPRDPADDFKAPAKDQRFFGADDDGGGVPRPRDFGDDLGPDVQYQPSGDGSSLQGMARPSTIQPVSATAGPVEYGFDTENYRWLQGILRFDRNLNTWQVVYSPAARDRFGGHLSLAATSQQLTGYREGDVVDIHGHVDPQHNDAEGRPLYHVETIVRI